MKIRESISRTVFYFILPIYTFVFSTTLFCRANNALLRFSLHARGYFNHRNFRESGEEFFVRKYLAKINPKVCIDVGANVGDYTALLVKETSSLILSFEPSLDTFKALEERFRSESCVKVKNYAIGESQKMITLFTKRNSCHNSRALDSGSIPERVEMITLDSLLKAQIDQIDFIKLDTEGFELECLEGAKRIIEEIHPAFIQVEYTMLSMSRGIQLSNISSLLGEAYLLYQLTPRRIQERRKDDKLLNIPFFSNFVYVCSKCLPKGIGNPIFRT